VVHSRVMFRKFRTEKGKKHARRRLLLRAVWLVAILCLVYGLLVFALWQKQVRIQHIVVESNNATMQEAVRRVVEEVSLGARWYGAPKDSTFLLRKKDIQNALLSAFPQAENVSVHRMSLDAVRVSIEEREQVAQWCGDVVPPDITFGGAGAAYGTCFSVDADGFIFAQVEKDAENSARNVEGEVRYYGALEYDEPVGQQFAPVEEFAQLTLLTQALDAAGYRVPALLIVDEREVEFALLDGTWVRVLRSDEPEYVIDRLVTTLTADALDTQQKLQYVDMRFGNKVYVKYAEQQTQTDIDVGIDVESDVDTDVETPAE